jgi:hypothetical protein
VNGKESWKTPKTDLLEVAKVRLREISDNMVKAAKARRSEERGELTMEECAVILSDRLESGFGLRGRGKNLRRIRKSTVHYRKQTLRSSDNCCPMVQRLLDRSALSPQRYFHITAV